MHFKWVFKMHVKLHFKMHGKIKDVTLSLFNFKQSFETKFNFVFPKKTGNDL